MPNDLKQMLSGIERLGGLAGVDEVIKSLAVLLRKTVRSRWVLVYFFDRERRNFTPARGYGLPQRYIQLFRDTPLLPDKLPLLKTLLIKKKHLLITDPAGSELLNPAFRKLLGPLSILAVPMIVRRQVTGAVFVSRPREYAPFSEEESVIIRDMVSYAALIISHERLFDESLDMALELAKRIDVILTLDEINRDISSTLSRDEIISRAMQNIGRVTECELASILEAQHGELAVISSHSSGIPIPLPLQSGAMAAAAPSSLWKAFSSGKSCNVPSLKELIKPGALDRALIKAGVNSLLAIPLISKDRVMGVMLLGDTDKRKFTRETAFTIEKIAAQMAVALENAGLYEDMRNLFIGTVTSLANAIDAKSPWTKGHSERVMRTAATIAKQMGLPDAMVERVRLGGLLHDIGKIGIIEALLEKPEKLSEDDFPPMRLHPEKGVAILAPIEQLQDVLPGILHHHEHYDGAGYPQGLKGEEIPLEARIITVADAFDAMVSQRPYKKGLSTAEALAELRENAGVQFDPKVVKCFTGYLERILEGSPAQEQPG